MFTGGPFTLFAPTNDAFKAVPEAKLNKLMSSPSELKTVLLGHLVNGTYFLGGLMHSPDLHTLDGGSNKITFGRMSIYVFILHAPKIVYDILKRKTQLA